MTSRLDAYCRFCRRATPDPDMTVCGFCHHRLHDEIRQHLIRATQKESQP